MKEPTCVNLGCGGRYREGWLNFDINPVSSAVARCDLVSGIPLADESCDLVYHSHVLEHMKPVQAKGLLRECFRILKPGGVVRVAVPDLEEICRLYLAALEGGAGAGANRRWMLLELYDQCLREESGGAMKDFLASRELPNEQFVRSRIGEEYHEIRKALQEAAQGEGSKPAAAVRGGLSRLRSALRGALLRLLLGREGVEALETGRFRRGGEIHQWMYDRVSLGEELAAAGFQEIVVRSATTSYIDRWHGFGLDALPDGTPVKPDSLYMEGKKGV